MKTFELIFDSETKIYLEIFERILNEVESVNYDYVYPDEYKLLLEKDISESHKIGYDSINL